MTGLAWTLARAGGLPRMLLVAACTAVVSGLLMVAVALLLLPPQPDELLFNLVADPGVRGGTAFGTVLLTLPALMLLNQAVRLGTAARERRLAALRLAGATPARSGCSPPSRSVHRPWSAACSASASTRSSARPWAASRTTRRPAGSSGSPRTTSGSCRRRSRRSGGSSCSWCSP